jgi:hypothetical protein
VWDVRQPPSGESPSNSLRRMWTLARATASEQLLATNILRVTTHLGLSAEALCIVSDTCGYYPKECRQQVGATQLPPTPYG